MIRFRVGLIALLILLAPAADDGGSSAVVIARAESQAGADDPLTLFTRMMPVFTHPRCLNCHGATDPFEDLNHGGGRVDSTTQSCTDGGCHVTGGDWKLASNAFTRQTNTELCWFMARVVIPTRGGPDGFIAHLRDDELIKQAYIGLMGGASISNRPDHPAMSHRSFLAAAQAWLEDGLAACDRDGLIVHTEEIESNTRYPGTHDLVVKQSGRREVRVRFAKGRYEANVQVSGSVTNIQTARAERNGVPCETVITSTTDYADVDTPTPGIPSNAGITARAMVKVEFRANGNYTVTVQLPEEKHRKEDHVSIRDGCGSGLQAPPWESLEQVWPATRFVFEGRLANPGDRTQLTGDTTRVWRARVSPDRDPWLPDHYAAAAQDGSFHPVTIRTRWNFRYRQR